MTMTMKIINKTELRANFGLKLITAADTGFPRGRTYYSARISQKLHGNEENFDVRGEGGSNICLCRSVTVLDGLQVVTLLEVGSTASGMLTMYVKILGNFKNPNVTHRIGHDISFFKSSSCQVCTWSVVRVIGINIVLCTMYRVDGYRHYLYSFAEFRDTKG